MMVMWLEPHVDVVGGQGRFLGGGAASGRHSRRPMSSRQSLGRLPRVLTVAVQKLLLREVERVGTSCGRSG
jgi:hypothetical protein